MVKLESTGVWFVLIHEEKDHTWRLIERVQVEGGREEALEKARDLCLSELGIYSARDYDGRLVFQTSETSWYVEMSKERWFDDREEPTTLTKSFKISIAELVHLTEPRSAERPRKRGLLRKVVNRD
jgi:hypothetical protein